MCSGSGDGFVWLDMCSGSGDGFIWLNMCSDSDEIPPEMAREMVFANNAVNLLTRSASETIEDKAAVAKQGNRVN